MSRGMLRPGKPNLEMKSQQTPSWRRHRTWLLLLALHVFGVARSLALDPDKSLDQYNCQSWTLRDHLPASDINALAQTRDGYLWLGTGKGLVRFDGWEFKPVAMPDRLPFTSRDISSLASSKAGGLWFGMNAGPIGYYDGQNFSPVTNVTWVNSRMDVHAIREDSNAVVWVAAETTVGSFLAGTTNEKSKSFGGLPGGWSVGVGRHGRVWTGTARRGLYYCQDGNIARFPDEAIGQSIVYAVAEDPAGRIWVGTDAGLSCFDANFHRLEIGEVADEVRALLVDRQGVVWIGTSGNGLLRWHNGRFTGLKQADGLANDFVTALLEDFEGSLWIGTRDGLSQITDVKFPIYSSPEGLLPGSCHAVAASPGGGLWAAMRDGFSYFDGQQATNHTAASGLRTPFIKRVFEAGNGDVYLINGAKQVEVFSGGRIVASYDNADWPSAMAEDAQGVLVAVANQLFRVSRDRRVPYAFTNGQVPPFQWIHNLVVGRDDCLWIASINGIFRVKNGTYQQWSVPEGLSWDKVHSLCEDKDGTLWAGLLTGLARLKHNQIRNISHANGLFDDFIFAVVPDDQGWLWVDSKRGIFRVSRQSLDDFCDGKTNQVQCDAYDGLENVKSAGRSDQEWVGCKTRDGRIWFPGPQGIVMINPARLPVNPTPPLVYLRQVRANGTSVPDATAAAVPHGRGNLEFYFTALSYIAPAKVHVRYQLEGYDHAWIEAGTNRTAAYANLKPGKYQFHVIAGNADNAWNLLGATSAIELRPDWYQTVWFYLGCALLAGGAVTGLYHWRVQHLRRRHDELEARVRERTAELEAQKQRLEHAMEERKRLEEQLLQAQKMEAVGRLAAGIAHDFNNLLTAIAGNASLLLMCQPTETAEIADCAQQIVEASERAASLTRQLLMFSRKQVIQPARQDLNKVVAHMTRLLQRILGEDVSLISQCAPSLPAILADAGMIEQILLNLAVNSRDAMPKGGQLTIATGTAQLAAEPAGPNAGSSAGLHVCLTVTDTGSGIAPADLAHIFEPFFTTKEVGKGTGLGLATVYGIVKQHQGRIVVESQVGRGTTFLIYFPALADAPPEPAATPATAILLRGSETILVVEDEFLVRVSITNTLQHLGYTILPAASSVEALKIWQQHKARIQLLLTDIVMPDGLTGYDLARQLQAGKPQLKVIYTSGYSGGLVEKRMTVVEGVNFLQKPYAPQKLAEALRKNLD